MAVTVRVVTNQANMYNFLYGPTGFGQRYVRRASDAVRNAAVRNAPRDTGTLANSITVSVAVAPGFVVGNIGSDLHYAIYQELGTGIYGPRGTPIRPVRAKALRFEGKSRFVGPVRAGAPRAAARSTGWVFAASVRGTPPTHFLTTALDQVMGGVATMTRLVGRR